MLRAILKYILGAGHVDSPTELITLCLIVDLLDWDIMFLAPVGQFYNKS